MRRFIVSTFPIQRLVDELDREKQEVPVIWEFFLTIGVWFGEKYDVMMARRVEVMDRGFGEKMWLLPPSRNSATESSLNQVF